MLAQEIDQAPGVQYPDHHIGHPGSLVLPACRQICHLAIIKIYLYLVTGLYFVPSHLYDGQADVDGITLKDAGEEIGHHNRHAGRLNGQGF